MANSFNPSLGIKALARQMGQHRPSWFHFLRMLALPAPVRECSLRGVQVKPIKMGKWLVFQVTDVRVPQALFQAMPDSIGRSCIAPW